MNQPHLTSIQIKNFKAIQDSQLIKLTPLTAFIGYNGSGKSSVIEGLETLQAISTKGLDEALVRWRGFEYIWNRANPHKPRQPKGNIADKPGTYELRPYFTNPLEFVLNGRTERQAFRTVTAINMGPGGNELFIQQERLVLGGKPKLVRDSRGHVINVQDSQGKGSYQVRDGESILGKELDNFIAQWQFLALVPESMGAPTPQKRTGGSTTLAKDGFNIAQYLQAIRDLDINVFDSLVETLQYILPYARDLQPTLTSELERAIYLQITEKDYKVPGWLLSTGTLRLLALLAVLRHPTPPPLIIIEEIENGLDPRTIHLLVDEIRDVVESGRSQVIITTHSPYLLDLLDLSQVVLVERIAGNTVFTRPEDDESLRVWAKRYSPGKLYTMNRLGGQKTE